jgi:hypothetical protein
MQGAENEASGVERGEQYGAAVKARRVYAPSASGQYCRLETLSGRVVRYRD